MVFNVSQICISSVALCLDLMQASSEHSVCFAVPEKEVTAVAEALRSRFHQALEAGRLSKVF